jgi:DNA-binding CsgD family transcriptional regulator
MATVYLAEDLKHRRRVAVKVLDPEVAAAVGAARFLREIEIAARLSHPHILPLHDSGEAQGLLFYTMPFVEGESLRDRLTRVGQLGVTEALALTRQVADALAYAHESQVVHRDIKPENILLSHGHALVADFGVARAIAAGASRVTHVGLTVGTPAYVSPEQALADRELDGRSDLYSLGCVLHEMLAGSPPFLAPSAQATIARRLTEAPAPIRSIRPDAPAWLETALLRTLAIEPSDRYSSAAEFVTALATAGGTPQSDLQEASGAVVVSNVSAAALRAQIQLNRGTCWQSLGQPEAAKRDLSAALATAQQLGDHGLLARSHNALLFLHIFIGPPATAREHGERGIALAEEAGDKTVTWAAHYGMATLAGLTGDGAAMLRHMERSEQIADEIQSPLLRVHLDELAIQYAFASGDWDAGIALAERTIATARALNQKTLLPRVLVWTTAFYTARGEYERAKQYLDEAWELAVARSARGRPIEVHSQVAVYAGFASYYLAMGDYARAVEIGEQGLAIADRAGYIVWATYRLLPVTAEAAFWKRDVERAQRLRNRMQEDCERMGHRLGLVWVAAGDGIIARLREDYPKAAELLRTAIDDLEKQPWVYDAARLRRWYADVLVRLGDQEGGVRELRKSHETCAALGARVEMERAREMMKTLGLRLPSREAGSGKRAAKLTDREQDIARLVAARKSNKEIAVALGISARTVTTHVANIFSKLGVSSRGELADRIREGIGDYVDA